MRIAALILAAGTSSRYRALDPTVPTKLVAESGGMPLVRRAAEAAIRSRAAPVVAVTGFAAGEVRAALSGLPVVVAHNPDYASGLSSSLLAGLSVLPDDVDGAAVLLGDMPGVTADLVDRLINAFAARPDAEAAVPVHAGRRGNPALLGRALFPAAQRLTGDEGARRLLARARVAEIEAGAGATIDVDEPGAVAAGAPDA